jgi:hypothetical protein
MAEPPKVEILGPEHEYDDSELTPKDFLLAVMRDRRVPLAARMDAAAKVAVYEHPRLAQVNQEVTAGLTLRIEGGLPALPGTDIIMPTTSGPRKTTNGTGGGGSGEPRDK